MKSHLYNKVRAAQLDVVVLCEQTSGFLDLREDLDLEVEAVLWAHHRLLG